MAHENRTSQAIPQEVVLQAQTKINELTELLKPFLVTLTKTERTNRTSMGDKTMAFVMKANELGRNNPQLMPGYLPIEEWNIDISLISSLKTLTSSLVVLNELLSDTRLEAGHEAYNSALLFYSAVKEAERANVSGAKSVYNELKQQFPKGKRKVEETNE